MRRRSAAIIGAAVVVLLAGCAASPAERGPLAAALSAAPGAAYEMSYTDWSRFADGDLTTVVRAGLGEDVLTRSVIGPQALVWEEAFGFSPLDLDWELSAHSEAGSMLALGWSGELGAETVESGLERAGFERDGEHWELGEDAALPVGLASVMTVVRYDAGARTLLAADDPEVFTEDSLLDRRAVAEVAAALGGSPESALFQNGPMACASAGVSGRGTQVAEQGREAARRAGGLVEPLWAVRAVDGEDFTVALAFEGSGIAADQARVRERLTTGPFIGRTGAVEDVLTEPRTSADGPVAVLSFTREATGPSLMSTTGPLLFAGC